MLEAEKVIALYPSFQPTLAAELKAATTDTKIIAPVKAAAQVKCKYCGKSNVASAICPGRLRIEPLVYSVVAALRDVEAEKRFGFELGTREATVEMIGSRCDIGDACCVLWATAWRLEPRMGYDGLA